MSAINKDTEKYLERFSETKFTEHDFLELFLPLLCQNGIHKINEEELKEIVNIADQTYETYQGRQTALTTIAPYVRQIILK